MSLTISRQAPRSPASLPPGSSTPGLTKPPTAPVVDRVYRPKIADLEQKLKLNERHAWRQLPSRIELPELLRKIIGWFLARDQEVNTTPPTQAPATDATAPVDPAAPATPPDATAPTETAPPASAAGPADESKTPTQFGQFGWVYGTSPAAEAHIVRDVEIKNPNVLAALATPPEAAQLAEGGIGNVFNPEWAQLVNDFVQKNGGLGDAQSGYLAYSSEYGFVRLKNPNLTDEQNRRLAEISLTMGMPIEKLPSRSAESAFDKPNVDAWVNKFIGSFDEKFAAFMQDPTKGFELKDGRRRYKMEFNEEAGRVVSMYYKKAGGLRGFFQKAMKYIAPIADIASVAFPGIGTAIGQAVKFAGAAIARGKLMASDLVGAIGGFLPGIGAAAGMTVTQTMAAGGILNAGARAIDGQKVSFTELASALGPTLFGGATPTATDLLYRGGLEALGRVVDGKLDSGALADLLRPFAGELAGQLGLGDDLKGLTKPVGNLPDTGNGLPGWANNLLGSLGLSLDQGDITLLKSLGKGIYQAVKDGKLSAAAVADALGGLVPQLTSNPNDQALIRTLLGGLAEQVDAGRRTPAELLSAIATGLKQNQQQSIDAFRRAAA